MRVGWERRPVGRVTRHGTCSSRYIGRAGCKARAAPAATISATQRPGARLRAYPRRARPALLAEADDKEAAPAAAQQSESQILIGHLASYEARRRQHACRGRTALACLLGALPVLRLLSLCWRGCGVAAPTPIFRLHTLRPSPPAS